MVATRGGTERGSVLAMTAGVDRQQRREWKLKGRGERSFFGRKERLLTSKGEKRDPNFNFLLHNFQQIKQLTYLLLFLYQTHPIFQLTFFYNTFSKIPNKLRLNKL